MSKDYLDACVKLKEKFFYDHNENYSTGHQ